MALRGLRVRLLRKEGPNRQPDVMLGVMGARKGNGAGRNTPEDHHEHAAAESSMLSRFTCASASTGNRLNHLANCPSMIPAATLAQ